MGHARQIWDSLVQKKRTFCNWVTIHHVLPPSEKSVQLNVVKQALSTTNPSISSFCPFLITIWHHVARKL
ncbi:hypothetical protein C8J56DRAFT_1046477 [Mycena floridula]|nr:hypothetical protein C8J56DRAFT_1046477 [Mycena floridula]